MRTVCRGLTQSNQSTRVCVPHILDGSRIQRLGLGLGLASFGLSVSNQSLVVLG